MIAFLDLTALAAYYIEDPNHQLVRAAVEGEESIAIATISRVHFMAMLDSLLADETRQEAVLAAGQRFIEDAPDFVQVQTEGALLEATTLAVRHHVSADQAIQLAAALRLERQLLRQASFLSRPVLFVTLDLGLAAAAMVEGLRVVPG